MREKTKSAECHHCGVMIIRPSRTGGKWRHIQQVRTAATRHSPKPRKGTVQNEY